MTGPATSGFPRGGAWNSDGVILFTGEGTILRRIPASGGEPATVTKLERGQTSNRFPQFLPDGRRFLFFAVGSPDAQGIYVGSLDEAGTRRLTASDSPGLYTPAGWLFYVRQETLVARRFDVARGELTGSPVVVADEVGFDGTFSKGAFSVSANGSIAYRAGSVRPWRLAWFDRAGKILGILGPPEGGVVDPELAPGGRQVAFRVNQGNQDVCLTDGSRTTRFTFDASEEDAVSSPITLIQNWKPPEP